jgi:large subunit ribosomal protein L3
MKKALLGKKLGMTQIFSEKGLVIPVTVVEAGPCYVTQVKTTATDGYNAIQLAYSDIREKLVNKPALGQFKKANVTPKRFVKEFKLDGDYQLGQELKCDIFAEGDLVDVTGKTKGHGYTGVIKKWNFGRMRMSHGNGPVHRHSGSIGSNTYPGKVFKGKKMSGRYGNEQVTIQNLQVVKVDLERNIILVKGAIPGAKGSLVSIKEAVKAK